MKIIVKNIQSCEDCPYNILFGDDAWCNLSDEIINDSSIVQPYCELPDKDETKYVCKHCGSDRVCYDASYYPNTDETTWNDTGWCQNCDIERKIIEQ